MTLKITNSLVAGVKFSDLVWIFHSHRESSDFAWTQDRNLQAL